MTDVESEFRRLGPYVLLRASGAGGMARIDLALRGRPEAADVCVLKRLHADYRSPEQEARFRREAAIARRLSHDAIARTLGIDEIDGELLLLQELVMGVDLRRLSARVAAIGERLPVPLAVYVVSEVARALHYAHTFRKLGIVHRDVTPDNIMLAFSGVVKLVDFGIARSNADATLTQAGFVVGRPVYTAPEVWTGARADRRSDVYSLGVVLWQLLTGRPLEPGETVSSPSGVNPDVPPALAAVNLRAFEADPARRYQSAGALHQALAPHLLDAFGAPAKLSELLVRHFDVAREQRMLAEDVANAKPLLVAGDRAGAKSRSLSAMGKNARLLLFSAAALLLIDGALWEIGRRRTRPHAVALSAPVKTDLGGSPIVAAAIPKTAAAPIAPAVTAHPIAAAPVAAAGIATTPAPATLVAATPTAAPDPAPDPTTRRNLRVRQARDPVRTDADLAHDASTPVNVEKLLADAQADFDRGELPAALTLARDAAHNRAGAPAFILIGTIMMNQRRYDDAERAFTEATKFDPPDARAVRLLAMVREIRKMGSATP